MSSKQTLFTALCSRSKRSEVSLRVIDYSKAPERLGLKLHLMRYESHRYSASLQNGLQVKIPQETLKELSSLLRSEGERQILEGDIEVFFTDDLSVAFGANGGGSRVFQGLSFEMVGKDFHILPNLDLLVAQNEEGEDSQEAFIIEDQNFVALTVDYLQWRAKVLHSAKL